jgi:hypothetical protein
VRVPRCGVRNAGGITGNPKFPIEKPFFLIACSYPSLPLYLFWRLPESPSYHKKIPVGAAFSREIIMIAAKSRSHKQCNLFFANNRICFLRVPGYLIGLRIGLIFTAQHETRTP